MSQSPPLSSTESCTTRSQALCTSFLIIIWPLLAVGISVATLISLQDAIFLLYIFVFVLVLGSIMLVIHLNSNGILKSTTTPTTLLDQVDSESPEIDENQNLEEEEDSAKRQFCCLKRKTALIVFTVLFILIILGTALAVYLLAFKESTSSSDEEPQMTPELLLQNMDSIRQELNQANVSLELWTLEFGKFKSMMSKLDRVVGEMNSQTAHQIANDSLDILRLLIPQPNVWNHFPITERAQMITDFSDIIISSFTRLLHQEQVAMKYTSDVIELVTQQFFVDESGNMNFTFGKDFFIQIPLEIVDSSKKSGSSVFGSAVLMRNLANYLSFDYSINSEVVTIIVGEKTRLSSNFKNQDKVTFVSRNLHPKKSNEAPGCTTWNSATQTWSTDTCIHIPTSDLTTTTCECTQMSPITTFASITLPQIDNIIKNVSGILDSVQNQENNLTTTAWLDAMQNVTELISQASGLEAVSSTQGADLANSSVQILNILIEQKQIWSETDSENALEKEEKLRAASGIVHSVEDLSILLDASQTEDEKMINSTNILLHTKFFNVTPENHISFDLADFELTLPLAGIANLKNSSTTRLASTAAVVKSLSDHLEVQHNFKVATQVLSIVIGTNRTGTVNLKPGHELRFSAKHHPGRRLIFGDRPQCTFWNASAFNWSSSGCEYAAGASSHEMSVCQCSHLTNFAVLIDINNQEVNDLWKAVLSYTASTLTIFFSIWAVIILIKQSSQSIFDPSKNTLKIRSNRAKINLHIAFWLITSHLLVVLCLDAQGPVMRAIDEAKWFKLDVSGVTSSSLNRTTSTQSNGFCGLTSLALLYSLLTTFSLMFLLNYHLYRSISKMNSKPFPLKKFTIAAYLYPGLIVAYSILAVYYIEFQDENIWSSTAGSEETSVMGNVLHVVQSFFDITQTKRWKMTLGSMYGNYFCWMSNNMMLGEVHSTQFHILIFIVPMTFTILLSILFVCITLYIYLRSAFFYRKNQIKTSNSTQPYTGYQTMRPNHLWTRTRNLSRHKVKLIIAYISLLNTGLPWTMYAFYTRGFLFGKSGALPFSIAFIIICGTQGLALFAEQYYLYLVNQKTNERRQRALEQSLSAQSSSRQTSQTDC